MYSHVGIIVGAVVSALLGLYVFVPDAGLRTFDFWLNMWQPVVWDVPAPIGNDQTALNISTLSSSRKIGHSMNGETVNGRAGFNRLTQSGEYRHGYSINDDGVNVVPSHSQPPIGICGMAHRLPAALKTPQQPWELLLAGGDPRGRIPSSRYNVAAFNDPTGKHGTLITEYGHFLDEDIGALDTTFFSMPRMEVERTDPQQRLMLQATRGFEDAGETAWRGKHIDCYMGSLGEDWCEIFASETQNQGPYRYIGYEDFALSNRVSYEMDLQGPTFVYTCNGILQHGTVITEYGYFLDEDIGTLNTTFLSMPRMEVERTDPQQRLMLEATREWLEEAIETALRGKRIGCYMGSLGENWCEIFARETQNWGPYRSIGYEYFALSNRVSYEMDLQGPRFVYTCIVILRDSDRSSMTTRTACSASLVALDEACVAISRGDCDSAIVGGANLIMTPGSMMSMSEQTVLSKDGSCKTFSADAYGYARIEVIAAVYIKRLDDALRDSNLIRAVIRGTATSHNSKTPGITVRSAKAQEALMRRAYKVAGITDFSKTGFMKCHGAGTAVGDSIEASAVGRVFGESGVYIGSIKPNFGHTEVASGLLSLIKTVLVLESSTIPPNIKFLCPNPAIPFESAKLTVPTSAANFNVSTVLKGAPNEPQLLLYSANPQKALTSMIGNYRDFVQGKPENIGNLAYTLANRREHLPYRAFAIASKDSIGIASPTTRSAKRPAVIIVFTGRGAQWPRMGRDIIDSNPTFLNSIRRLDKYLQGMYEHAPEWKIEAELRKTGKQSRVCTAIQIALVDTLAALGIQPDAAIGHSRGEIAGVYAAGALTAEEAIINALHGGAVTNLGKRSGAMASIGMSWKETEKYLVGNVPIACDNRPKNVTISGDVDEVEAVIVSTCSYLMVIWIEVQFHCHSQSSDRIGWIKEVSTCSYLMVIYSPRLCHDVFFLPPHEYKANAITCGQVVPELDIPAWQHKVRDDIVFPFAGYVAVAGEAIDMKQAEKKVAMIGWAEEALEETHVEK